MKFLYTNSWVWTSQLWQLKISLLFVFVIHFTSQNCLSQSLELLPPPPFLKKKFIYFWLWWVFGVAWAFSSCTRQWLLLVVMRGSSLGWLLLLWSRSFSSCGLQALVHWLMGLVASQHVEFSRPRFEPLSPPYNLQIFPLICIDCFFFFFSPIFFDNVLCTKVLILMKRSSLSVDACFWCHT